VAAGWRRSAIGSGHGAARRTVPHRYRRPAGPRAQADARLLTSTLVPESGPSARSRQAQARTLFAGMTLTVPGMPAFPN